MKTKHTPGPWSATGNEIRVSNGIPMLLATVNNSDGAILNGYPIEANAKLIAASPELLEACIKALDTLIYMTTDQYMNGGDKNIRKMLSEAILKATK